MSEYDAIVVGSGPNGLVAALTMAEAGRRVLLLEGAETFGGGLRSAELTLPGFTHDVCATVLPLSLASPALRDRLPDLAVEFAYPEVSAAHPLDDGPAVLIHRDPAETAAALGQDGRAWQATVGATARAGFPLIDTLLSPLGPPKAPVAALRYGALAALPATVLARSLFRTAPARAAFAGMAAHAMLDLRHPITGGYGLLLAAMAHSVGWPVVRGGSQVMADLMVERLRKLGAETVSGHRVTSLRELPPAGTVLLDLTPRQFLAVADLPPGYARRLSRFRQGPGVFKVDWALDGPVPWRDPRISAAATVHLGGTLAEIAASETATANGRIAANPYVLVVQPCVADPTRAPEGRQTLWAYCHVPNGSDHDMTSHIEAQIERFAPGFRDRVLARHVMSPAAMESHNPNYVGGDIGGGSAEITQFFGRPVHALKPWRTPLDGVYLCSSSTPPGAGVHGMGGHHAATLALRDRRHRR
ncbi:P49 secreted protein [Acrocarpospora corrugata]|uniref:P49 secreted protein n=1 Tax=Acrocarpospora corrugata TaxID=35763 RepID=A0A5M3W437_9ACTN|nr:NAD(P)/FAD-dependent oxidoreductase [Acrocarpospora corrugata]GES03817.1 P49 secreted protein [Acrocarpospora corrugata]